MNMLNIKAIVVVGMMVASGSAMAAQRYVGRTGEGWTRNPWGAQPAARVTVSLGTPKTRATAHHAVVTPVTTTTAPAVAPVVSLTPAPTTSTKELPTRRGVAFRTWLTSPVYSGSRWYLPRFMMVSQNAQAMAMQAQQAQAAAAQMMPGMSSMGGF
jgi:hypothetical protein